MTNGTQNPRREDRGLTIKESLNLLRKNLPQPAPSVNEECEACAYFHESIQGKKNSRRAHSVCAFSGEPTPPNQEACTFFARGETC